MQRLAEPLLDGGIGGWSPIESPPLRTATTSQQWSVAIAIVAALVAMMAVFFDLRLPSESSAASVLPIPSSIAVESNSVGGEAVSQVAEVPPPASVATVTSERSLVGTGGQESATVASSASASADDVALTGASSSVVSSTVTNEATAESATATIEAGGASAAETALALDPASRIREYLGIHSGAPLPGSFTYLVEAGDTASSIAARFGLNEATVLFNNFDIYDPSQLTIGQRLTLPSVDGLVYTIQTGDTFSGLMANFQGDADATLALASNSLSSPDQIYVGQTLVLVHGSASVARGSVASSSGGGQSTAVWTVPTFLWPLGFDEISDYFGTARANSVGYHTGVDFTAAVGTIVGSTAAGQVTVATWDPSYGNWVEVDHGGGYRSRYAHLNEIFVREGEWVPSNAYIGTVGNTGNSSGAHLHFEIIVDGQAVNPLAWLN